MIAPNTVIGSRYRVVKLLGGGGMKQVYLAEDLRLATRPCALAEMVDSFSSAEMQRQAVASFQREADLLARLNHEHIPRIFDRFSERNHHYLVMEYVSGVTLEEALKSAGGRLDPSAVVEIALQVLETLEYLHGLDPPVIYRDLKPSNVMIASDGRVKLIDFGIARHFRPLSGATMVGTQGYAPPEQYRGKVELRSDLYALGATMHHALSGRDPASEPPFSFPPLLRLCPEAGPLLAGVVDAALSYDVAARIPSASAFRRRLLEITPLQNGAAGNGRPVFGSAAAAEAGAATEPAQPPDPALAPTRVIGGSGVRCPGCGSVVPADSRFCSYCAADLSRLLNPWEVVGNEPQATAPTGALERARGAEEAAAPLARRHARPAILLWVGLCLLGVLLYKGCAIAMHGFWGAGPEDVAAGRDPGAYRGGPPAPDSLSAPRLAALRVALNLQGYQSVYFKLQGSTIVLWGSVPTETDRIMVQTMVFTMAGVYSIDDRLKVENRYGGP